MASIKRITTNGKAIYLAYDQGLEHGSADFNDANINPLYVIDIAKKGVYNGIVFQKGVAEKYNNEIKKSKIPLIIKLNGKTNLFKGEPISRILCSVKEAIKLGASAVGYTIYIGSQYENIMMKEFEELEREAHNKGIPVIAWVYPRGKSIEGKTSRELISYATRVGLELGADIVKVHWNGNLNELKWAVKAAGRTKVMIAGGLKKKESELLHNVRDAMKAGAIGLAVGRNVWQHPKPLEITEKIKKIIFKNDSN